MTRRLLSAALAAATLTLGGCETFVQPDVRDFEPQLVVVGFFGPPIPGPIEPVAWSVQVSRTVALGDAAEAASAFVTDATVRVLNADGDVEAVLEHVGGGRYQAEGPGPVVGVPYRLVVTAPGSNEVWATSAVPPFPSTATARTDGASDVVIEFDDPTGVGDAYALEVGVPEAPGLQIPFASTNPSIVTGSFYEAVMGGGGRPEYGRALFDDDLFDGGAFEARLAPRQNVLAGGADSVVVSLTALSPDAYRYLRSVQQAEQGSSNPFADPIPLKGNVEGGLGAFVGVHSRVVGRFALDTPDAPPPVPL